jgi:hypothetical protein
MIGPSRVTLASGATIDGIAVITEADRIRVVLESGTEIALEPTKVLSVTALADLEREAEEIDGERIAELAGMLSNAATRPPLDGGVPPPASAGSTGEPVHEIAQVFEGTEVEEGARALAGAVLGALTGAEPSVSGVAPGGTSIAAGGIDLEALLPEPDAARKIVPAKPEELDATRPVIRPGFRVLGGPPLPGDEDRRPIDFPKPARPTISLGASRWQPSEGFSSAVRWPRPLPPATSFATTLSGFGKPTTSLGPTYFSLKPATWPRSTFPETWTPTDGFTKGKAKN